METWRSGLVKWASEMAGKGASLCYNHVAYAPSWHCTAKCAHCFLPAGIRRKDGFQTRVAEQLLAGIPDEVSYVCLTGGEPFEHPRRLLQLIRDARQRGKWSTITSNGLWFHDEKRGRRLLENAVDAGLRALSLSLDPYRRPVLAIESLATLLALGASLGLSIDLKVLGDVKDPSIRYLQNRGVLGDRTESIGVMPLERVGGGRRLPAVEYPVHEQDRCAGLLMPTVLPDGTVMACCSVWMLDKRSTALAVGRLDQEPLGAILHRAARNPVLAAMAAFGPAGLAARIPRLSHVVSEGKSRCQNCLAFLNDPALQKNVEQTILGNRAFHQEMAGRLMMLEWSGFD